MNKEPTRTRIHGTKVTMPKTGEERITAIREIVNRHAYAKVDGVMVDSFTASAIIQIYDNMHHSKNKEFYATFSVERMADIAWDLLEKQRSK